MAKKEEQQAESMLKQVFDKVIKDIKAETKKTEVATSSTGKPRERRWFKPNKRAESYAQERKAKVHQRGEKEGKPLTDFEAGLRSGYLQCQSDHAGLYKYKKALDEGKSKSEAKRISKIIGKGK